MDRPISSSEYRLVYEVLKRMYEKMSFSHPSCGAFGTVLRDVAMKIADDVVR